MGGGGGGGGGHDQQQGARPRAADAAPSLEDQCGKWTGLGDGGLLSQTTGRRRRKEDAGVGGRRRLRMEDEGDIGFGPGGIGRVFVWLVTERPLRASRVEFPALRRLKRSQRALRQGRLLPSGRVEAPPM